MPAWTNITGESSDADPRSRCPAYQRAMRHMSAALASAAGGGRGDIANCYVAALLEFARTVTNDNGIFARAKEIAEGKT